MNKSSLLPIAGFLIVFGFLSCSDGGGSSEQAVGTITLVSVSPSSGLTDGDSTDFTVTVAYSLSSGQGELGIGFNTSSISTYSMDTSAEKIISSGAGGHTFSVNATAKDWDTSGDFEVMVIISEYPHDSAWSPLDSDTMALTF